MEWLSQQYLTQQNLSSAETYAVELLRVQEALHGENGGQTVTSRWWLDYVGKLSNQDPAALKRMLAIEAEIQRLVVQSNQAAAAAEIEKLIPLEEAALGSDHPFFANTCLIQADCLLTAKQFAAAETAASRALSIRRKQLGDQHPDTAMVAFLLARSRIGQERHTDALEPLELAHDALLASLQFVNAAWMDSWRGDSLAALQRPAEAKTAYQAALAAFREKKGAEGEAQQLKRLADLDGSVDLKVERNHLWEQAQQSRANRELKEAAALAERMLAIERASLSDDSTEITSSLGWLADVYENLEQWGKAESRREEILRRETTRLGETHWQVTDARLAVEHVRLLASLTDEQPSQLSLAEELGSTLKKKHAEGAFTDTIPDAQGICEIRKTILGERHPDYATSLNNLAVLYTSMGDAAKAEPLCLKTLQIVKNVLGERHPDYATCLTNLAVLYSSMGDVLKAEPLCLQALEILRDVLARAALVQSERQQLAMGQMLRYRLDSYVSFTLQSGQFQASAAREILRWKGATLVRQRAMRLAAEDPAIADRFRALQQVSRRLASLSRTTPAGDLDNWKTQITDLTAEKERLEAQLSRDSSAFRSAMEEITPQQIQAAVPRDAVLIDYLQFTRSRPAKKKGKFDSTTSLLAVIVKHDGEPQLVELGPVAKLSGAIDTSRETFGMSPQGQQAGLQIRRQIWEPLLPHIGDATTILVSVDGVLGRMPLGALPGKTAGTYLIEDHRLAMIPVPQLLPALVSDLGRRDLSRELLLLGDVNYDSEPAKPDDDAPKKRKKRRPGESRGDTVGSEFRPLPGSADEVDLIEKLYVDLFETEAADIQSLNQSTASESAFREFAGQFRHLHLATHGFFSPATVQSALSPEAIREGAQRRLAVETPAASSVSVPRITGIGAQLEVVADGAVVEQFIPDGPAARHGKLKTGDVIIGVGSGDDEIVSVAGMSLEQIVQRIRGQEGSTVRLQIKPADSEELQVYSLVRAVVPGTGGVAAPSNTAPQMDPGDVQVTGFNPDLLSGLALAGANLQPGPGRDDGILTAQEIAFLPLNGVDTVVLSACETGLGNTAGGEGLISVQRAFQISGARTTLASFWKVNDVVTQRLMVRFYRNLWEKDMSRLDALREAQLYVLNNPDAIRGASLDPDEQSRTRVSPLYWAAFTLSGDWR